MTLRDAIEQYIGFRRALGTSCTGIAAGLRRYSRHVGDATDCDRVTDTQAADFLAHGGRNGSNYRAWKHSVLNGFYQYARARGLVARSPLPAERPRQVPVAPPYIYSPDDLQRLLEATRTYSKRVCQLQPETFRTLLLLLYGTGLRPGEALRLVQSDVDLDEALLTVRQAKCFKLNFNSLILHVVYFQ